jgi:tol-pal system protein YbgF
LAAALFGGISGCASQSDIRILEDRVIALERRNLELQQKAEEASAIRNQSASLHAATDEVRNEIRTLNGKIEETRHQLAEASRQSDDLNRRVARIEERLELPVLDPVADAPASRAVPPAGEAPASTVPPPAPGTAVGPVSENELYALAKQAFDRGAYQEARDGFQKLLLEYPDAKHADSAQFWVGETFYRQKEYEQAILEYQTVIEKYPAGNKVRAALLKQGFAFVGIGDRANARLILQELIEKYPNSSEAKIARQKISAL